jgi:hypothetical protein
MLNPTFPRSTPICWTWLLTVSIAS